MLQLFTIKTRSEILQRALILNLLQESGNCLLLLITQNCRVLYAMLLVIKLCWLQFSGWLSFMCYKIVLAGLTFSTEIFHDCPDITQAFSVEYSMFMLLAMCCDD